MPSPLALVQAETPFGNGSFEVPVIEERFVTFNAGEMIGPWVVTAGQVDLVFSAATAQDGRQSIDLAGFTPGIICQSFATTTGATYDVSFSMSHNSADVSSASLSAIVTGITSVPFTHNTPSDNITDPQWERHTLEFIATGGSSELCFESTDPPLGNVIAGAALLDNLTVTEQSAGPGADLALTKADAPDPVRVGQALTYTLRVTNNGPSDATGVALTDTLPARVSFGSAEPDQGSCSHSGDTVHCELGALGSGARTGVRIVVTPTVAGTPTNTATVRAEQHDPNENDNTAEQATTVDPGPFGNGSFEVPVIEDVVLFRTISAGETIGPWVVTEGDVDIQSTWARAQHGRQSVDMSGHVGGKICQRFATTTGATYEVSFRMSRNTAAGLPSASLAAIVTGITSLSFTHDAPSDNTDPQWDQHVFSFTATGGISELCFASTDPRVGSGPNGAAMLDNVTVQSLSEPDTDAPTLSLATPAVAGTTGDATPTFSGAAGDAPGDSVTITVKIYSGSDTSGPLVQTLTTTRSGSIWSVEGSSPLAPGTYTVQAEQSDAAGNVGLSSPSTFAVSDATGGGGGGGGGAIGGAAGAGGGASQQPGPPTVGKTFNVEPVSGVVTFKCGNRPQRPLEEAEQLPIGCRIDTRRGKVEITSAAGNGKTQSAVFSGGLFVVRQKAGPKPVTELRLVGKLENCPAAGSASTAALRRAKPGRRLWGSGKGAFRTRGRRSAATVTGTKWLVEDRCDGSTLTKVFIGRVKVRDFVRDKTITLTRGQSYIARPRSRGRR